jgi:hypothetical protein
MNPVERWSLRIGAFAAITTGVALGLVRYLGGREGEFGPEPSAALPFWQHAHVLVVPVLVFALGMAVAGHAKLFKARFERGGRSGLLLGVFAAPVVLGGAAIQIFTDAQLRAWMGWLHAAFGALFAALYCAHWSTRSSRQTRLPADPRRALAGER